MASSIWALDPEGGAGETISSPDDGAVGAGAMSEGEPLDPGRLATGLFATTRGLGLLLSCDGKALRLSVGEGTG